MYGNVFTRFADQGIMDVFGGVIVLLTSVGMNEQRVAH